MKTTEIMKALKKLSKKAEIFCDMSGYDADKVRWAMKTASFEFIRCESKEEMDHVGVDYAFPYAIWK